MDKVRSKVREWFDAALAGARWPDDEIAGASALRLALLASGAVPDTAARAFAALAAGAVAAGATVVVPESGALAESAAFRDALLEDAGGWRASVAYGQPCPGPGLHVMQSPTESAVEVVTGLGGTGAEVMLAHLGDAPLASHPMIPLLQVSADEAVADRCAADLDLVLDPQRPHAELAGALLERVAEVASRRYTPKLFASGMTGFQLTRGLLGLSM
jgi:hypothetical protein